MALTKTTFSLADVTSITGLKRRTVQLWAEAGVFKASPQTEQAGTGVHRSFPWEEVAIACKIAPLNSLGLPIRLLKEQAKFIRSGSLRTNALINWNAVHLSSMPALERLYKASGMILAFKITDPSNGNVRIHVGPDKEEAFLAFASREADNAYPLPNREQRDGQTMETWADKHQAHMDLVMSRRSNFKVEFSLPSYRVDHVFRAQIAAG